MWIPRAALSATLVAIALVVGACGSDGGELGVASEEGASGSALDGAVGDDGGGIATERLPQPGEEARIPPPPEHSSERLSANPNQKDGALGSLCWARWEVARNLLSGLGGGPEEGRAAEALGERVQAALDDVQHLSGLSENVVAFAQRFRADLEHAGDELGRLDGRATTDADRLALASQSFDFEQYPGVESYMSDAAATATCASP